MKRVLEYFKPYLPALLAVIVMLFIQANLELALPGIMSEIVTKGIQQQGVEDAVPLALSPSHFEALARQFSPEEEKTFRRAYRLLSPLSSENQKNLQKRKKTAEDFPVLETEELYVLDSREEIAGLIESGALINAIAALSPVPIPPQYKEQGVLRILATEYDNLGYDQSKRQPRVILRLGGKMLLFTILSVGLVIIVGFLAARSSAGLARRLRFAVFDKILNFSQADMDGFSTASLITRNTNDITQIQQVVFMVMRIVIFAPLMGIGGFIKAMSNAPSMGWIIGLAVLCLLGFVSIAISLALPRFRIIQTLVDRVNQLARENLTGLPVVRAFNMEKFQKKRFDKANKELTATNLFVMRIMTMMMPAIALIMNLLSVAVIWVGARQIAESGMNVGDMMAFLQYAIQIVISFMMMTMIFAFLPRAAVSADRIAAVLDKEVTIKPPENPEKREPKGILEFKNVGFRYPGGEENALSEISFQAEPGKITAIIGSTGSGKSTLVNIIPRLYDITEGQLLLDGVDVKNLDLTELRKSVALVPQKNVLFKGTIASNVGYGQDTAGEEELTGAALLAQAGNILEEKEGGLQGEVAQGGANFSGGQKQRLAIARALASKRQILIFDDSFSALDFKTDRALRQGLQEKCRDKTLLIVAQRVSTIMNADQIIVLDEGKITGMGTHRELLKSCATYKEIAQSQLNLEELA